jgi:hypothetical protein
MVMLAGCGDLPRDANASDDADAPSALPDRVTPDLKAYEQAGAQLVAKLGQPGTSITPPDENDPSFRVFRDQAWALKDVLGSSQFPVGIKTSESVCGPATSVILGYQLAGAHALPKGGDEAATVNAITQLSTRNMAEHFDQLFPIMIFGTHCLMAHIPVMEDFVKNLPSQSLTETRIKGIRQIRSGVFNSVSGLMMMISDPQLGQSRRTAVLKTLAEDVSLLPIALPQAELDKIRDQLQEVRPFLDKETQPYFEEINEKLVSVHCGALCST